MPAIGSRGRPGPQGPPGVGGRADRGGRCVDVRDYGVSPAASPAVNRIGLQAALDAIDAGVAENANNAGGIVYLPTWDAIYADRPVHLDRSNVKIQGEGLTRSRIHSATGHDVLAVGIPRRPQGVALNANHFVDLYTGGPSGAPLLDSSAVTAAGQKWAFRTRAIAHAVQQGGPLDQGRGDWYGTARKLTVSAAIDFSHATAVGAGTVPLFGLQDAVGASPFVLYAISGQMILSYCTAGPSPSIDEGVHRSVYLGNIPPGLCRLDFLIDLDAGVLAAWIGGTQVAPTPTGGPALTAGLSFFANRHAPFGIGSGSHSAALLNGTADDLTFCGLKVTAAALYAVGSAGSTIARVDGQAVNDLRRYFASESALVGLLPLDDSASIVTPDRVLSVQGPDGQRTTAYVLDNTYHAPDTFNITGPALEGICLLCVDPRYGRAVALGGHYGFAARGCMLAGGAHGVGALTVGANYPITIDGCELSGCDSPAFFYYASMIVLRDIALDRVVRMYRAGLRFWRCGQVRVHGMEAPHRGTPEFLIWAKETSFEARDVRTDNENPGQGSKFATIYASPSGDFPISDCKVIGLAEAFNGPNAVVFHLAANGTRRGRLEARSIGILDAARPAVVRVMSNTWGGTVEAYAPIAQPWVDDVSGAGKVVAVAW